MTTLREAAQQALEALWYYHATEFGRDTPAGKAITALQGALAEPAQEPVAWRYKKEGGGWFVSDNEPQYVEQWNDIEEIQPLYAAPPQRKPLTEEEIDAVVYECSATPMGHEWELKLARAIERAHEIR